MRLNCLAAAAVVALTCLGAGGAWAATAIGRITYISAGRHQLMLDSNDMCTAGPALDMSAVAVADRVRVNWEKKGAADVITGMVKVPLAAGASG